MRAEGDGNMPRANGLLFNVLGRRRDHVPDPRGNRQKTNAMTDPKKRTMTSDKNREADQAGRDKIKNGIKKMQLPRPPKQKM